MKKQSFKIGDKVLTINNSAWGLKPMTIIKIDNDWITAKHPDFSIGGFLSRRLVPWTQARQNKLNKVSKLKEELEALNTKLFYEKY